MKLKPIVSAAACGLSLWSVDANAAIAFEDHFYDGGIATNTPPASGGWVTAGASLMSESDSALRWTALGAWNWAGANAASADNYSWPTGSQTKSVEWEIGPMIVTVDGAQTFGDIRFQCGLFSVGGSKADAQLYPNTTGCIAIEINAVAGSTTAFANLQLKDSADGAENNGATLANQSNIGIDTRVSHRLRLDLTETEVKYYVDNNLAGTASLADYNLALAPVEPDTVTEFSQGFFINNWGGRIDNGEGYVSLNRVTVKDSEVEVDIDLPVAPSYPTPTLSMEKLSPGLHILNKESQFRRQTLRTTGSDYSWVGDTYPKTYSFTVAEAPVAPNFEVVMFFSPYNDYPGSSPDYSRDNGAVLRLGYNGVGNCQLTFAYKVGWPNSNGPAGNSYYENDSVPSSGLGGRLASLTSSTFAGTWSITFTSATNFTLTGPLNETTTGEMLPETSAVFVNPMMVGVGTFNGADTETRANGANECVFSNITIAGASAPINENFTTLTLNPLLTNAGESNSANYLIAPDTSFLVKRAGGTAFWLFQKSTDLGVTDPWENKISGWQIVLGDSLLSVSDAETSADSKGFWRLLLDAPLAPQAP